MSLEELSDLDAVKKRLGLRIIEPAVRFKLGGNRGNRYAIAASVSTECVRFAQMSKT